jgi:glutathione peroxidase
MKSLLLILSFSAYVAHSSAQATETFHDFTVESILGDMIDLSQYAGKKLLVVNTASFCAYTPQFETLEALDSTYEQNNFEVIGFPCNDFGGQDPGTNQEILDFCEGTYGVSFQMMARVAITSADTAEVYKWLQLESRNGVASANVTWNFNKFCIDEYGHWVMHFPQQTHPDNTAIIDWILSETPTNVETNNAPVLWNIINNPASDFVTISVKDMASLQGNIQVLSPTGQLVDQITNGNLSNGVFRYDVSNLSTGIYYIALTIGNQREVKKLSVVR